MPPAAESVPIRLRVVPDGERELWIRHFGEHELRSVQWLHRGELLEKLGPVTFSYDLIVEENAFRMFTKKTWLFGWIPWPRFLSPKGTGEEIAEGDSIRADVRVKMPLLGEIIRYEGTVTRC